MPIIQSTEITSPSDILATNTPTNGQVLAATTGGEFTWVDNSGAAAQTELTQFIEYTQRRGFVDITQFEITLTGAQKDTVLFHDLGAGYDFYLNGTLYHLTGDKSIALTGGSGNAHTAGQYYVYADTADMTLKVKSSPFNFNGMELLIAAVEWNGALPSGERSLLSLECHTCQIDSKLHGYLHFTRGYQLVPGGGDISGYNLNSGLKADKQFSISSARCYDEDLIHVLDALVGGDGQYCNYYRTGTGVWGWSLNNDYPFRISTNPSGRVLYDDGLGGAEAPSISYMNIYEVLTNIEGQARHIFLTSQTTYATQDEAYAASFSNLDLAGFPLSERVVSHKITIEVNDATSGDGHCYYERIANYSISPSDISAGALGVPTLVENTIVDHFVSFANTAGGQKDSGKKASDFEPTLTKGNLTSANNRLSQSGGTGAVIGSGVSLTLNEGNIIHQNLSGAGTNAHSAIDSHIASTSNPHTTTAAQVGSPALVNPSVDGNLVAFDGIVGLQKDSGKKSSDFEPTIAKGNLTAGSTKISIGGTGTSSLIGVGASVDVVEANIVHQNLSGKGTNTHAQIDSHISATGTSVHGLGTISTQASDNVSITGGTISGATITGSASLNVLKSGDTMSGALNFSGTTNSGVKLNNLTTTQRDALTSPANGMVIYNTTDNRLNMYANGAWTAGYVRLNGDTMTGKLNTIASAAVAGAGLNIPAGVVANTPVDGDLFNTTAQNALSVQLLGLRENLVGTIYSKLDNTTVTASVVNTAETSLIGSGTGVGTLTLPANMLVTGKTIRFRCAGLFTSSGGGHPTLNIKFKAGSNILAATGAITTANSLTNQMFTLTGDFTVRSVGSSGTIIGQGLWTFASAATTFSTAAMLNTTAVTINTTGTLALDATATFSSNTAANSITTTNAVIELLN